MALAELTISPSGYEIRTSRETLTIELSPRGRALALVFRGPWRDVRKAVLIRKLIAKQFEPLVPRLRIRLRGPAVT
jgi:hypothetical protein